MMMMMGMDMVDFNATLAYMGYNRADFCLLVSGCPA